MNYYNIYNYSWYIVDGIKFYINPYGYIYDKVFCKETLKQICIITHPYTKDYILSKLAREIKEVELDNINKDIIKHV